MKFAENVRLTFDESAKDLILGYLDKTTDSEGYIVELSNPSQRVLSKEGEEVTLDEFGGACKGSEVFIKNDLISLMRISMS